MFVCDLKIMIPFKYIEFIDDLISLVKNNVVPMDRIDDAVGRILLVKFTMGLFENPLADLSLVNELGSQVSLSEMIKYQDLRLFFFLFFF